MSAGQGMRIHGVVSEVLHPATAVMKGGKGGKRDRGKDAEYFHPAGHAMGRSRPVVEPASQSESCCEPTSTTVGPP